MSANEDGSAEEADRKRKNSEANKKSPKSKGLSFFHKGLEYLKYGWRLIFWIFRDRVLDFIKEGFDLLF